MTHKNETEHRREHRPILLESTGWPEAPVDPALDHMPRLLSQHVRGIYCDYRRMYDRHRVYDRGGPVRRYDGRTDRHGVVHPPFWPKLVRHFVSIEADPEVFTRTQFTRARLYNRKVPLPPDLLGDEARQAYLEVVQDEQRQIVARMQREIAAIRCEAFIIREGLGWEPTVAMRYGLGKEIGMPVDPLLRYCLAVEHGCDQLACRHHDSALMQYVFQRSCYDRGEACRIPDCLRSEGALLVKRLCNTTEEREHIALGISPGLADLQD